MWLVQPITIYSNQNQFGWVNCYGEYRIRLHHLHSAQNNKRPGREQRFSWGFWESCLLFVQCRMVRIFSIISFRSMADYWISNWPVETTDTVKRAFDLTFGNRQYGQYTQVINIISSNIYFFSVKTYLRFQSIRVWGVSVTFLLIFLQK